MSRQAVGGPTLTCSLSVGALATNPSACLADGQPLTAVLGKLKIA
jgi:hypothetical protein